MRRLGVATVLLAAVAVAVGACSKSVTPGAATTTTAASLPFESSPSKDELARVAGLRFPASTAGYQSVRVDPSELDVSFTIAATDVDGFASGSGLGALAQGRVIQHGSPVFPQNPTGTVRSAVSTHGRVTRVVEVVDDPGQPTSIRLIVTST